MFKNKFIFIIALSSILIASCKKDKNVLGNNVQPSEDALNASFTDKLNVVCYTKKYDSIACYNSRYRFLGVNNDPYFGYMNVGLYLNANLNASNWDFGSSSKINSSEIVLVINSNIDFSGDKTAINSYSVFLLDSSLSTTRVYLSNNEKLYNKTKLVSSSNLTFTSLSNGKLALRIPIDTAFSGPLMRGTGFLKDNDTFLSQYKGFYIKVATTNNHEGTIYLCDLEDDDSGFFLKYKDNKDSLQSFKFSFSGNSSVKFNTVKYDYSNSNTNLRNQINGDTIAGTMNLFLKGLGDTKIRVYIPNLKSIADSFNVAVNRAEVSFYIDDVNFPNQGKLSDDRRYNIPIKLALIACDSTGKENYIIDQTNPYDAGRYDGGYDEANKRYVFNIARHAQAILNGKRKNYGFYLVMADPDAKYTVLRDNYSERVVLAGSSNSALKPKIELSYIKFKHP